MQKKKEGLSQRYVRKRQRNTNKQLARRVMRNPSSRMVRNRTRRVMKKFEFLDAYHKKDKNDYDYSVHCRVCLLNDVSSMLI